MAGSLPTTRLVVAGGVEIRDGKGLREARTYVESAGTKVGIDRYEYKGSGREYEITFVYSKAEFARALDLEGAIVIYEGHSRYGQGPTFGEAGVPAYADPVTYPLNPWGDHFRMGYDAVRTACLADVWLHGVKPNEYTTDPPPKMLFAWKSTKEMLARKGNCNDAVPSRRSLLGCLPDLPRKLELVDPRARREYLLDERNYWYRYKEDDAEFKRIYVDEDGYIEYQTIVESNSTDLDAVGLKCGLLYMDSCSSKWHFYDALKRRKTATGSRCVFYLTKRISYDGPLLVFIKLLLAGVDPLSASGSKTMVTKLNATRLAGKVEMMS